MSDYYKLAGSKNSTVDWTTEVILAKDEDGNVTKSVGVNAPAQLNKDDLDKLEQLGFEVESSSKEEAEEAEAQAAVSADALASAPLIGDGPSQQAAQSDQASESKSNTKKS